MIGDLNWGKITKGDLNLIAKLRFTYNALEVRSNVKKSGNSFKSFETTPQLPDSKLVKQTLEFIQDTHRVFLINHCIRTFCFGKIIGTSESMRFDDELLAVAALLHDIGLTEKHQFKHENCNCFAVEGALEAGLFLEKQRLDIIKIETVQNAISMHLNIKVPSSLPEAYLLNKGAAADVIGQNLKHFQPHSIQKITEQYPRLNLKKELHQVLKHQCSKRPRSRIAFLYRNGFGNLIYKAEFED